MRTILKLNQQLFSIFATLRIYIDMENAFQLLLGVQQMLTESVQALVLY